MTIDEAIKHYLEVAKEQSRLYSLCPCPCDGTDNCMSLKNGEDMGCTKCAAEHRQLAEWLTELKKRRVVSEIEKMTDIKEYIERELRSYERDRDTARLRAETNKIMQQLYNEFACVLRDMLALLDKED